MHRWTGVCWFVPGISGQGSLVVDSSNHYHLAMCTCMSDPTWLRCFLLPWCCASNQTESNRWIDNLVLLCPYIYMYIHGLHGLHCKLNIMACNSAVNNAHRHWQFGMHNINVALPAHHCSPIYAMHVGWPISHSAIQLALHHIHTSFVF